MINLYISIILGILSFQAFTFTYRLGGINKTIINIPKAIFEKSIPIVSDSADQEFKPYFDKSLLELNINGYISNNIGRYSNNYTLVFYYYNSLNNLICRGDKCDGVRITINTKMIGFFDYERTMFYEIRNNNG